MRNERTKEMTLIAATTAIMAVILAIQAVLAIHWGIEIAIVHVLVIIGAIYGGKRVALSLGLIFGLLTMIVAFMTVISPLTPIFRNPLISVLPRVIFGALILPLYSLFGKLLGEFKHREKVRLALTAGFSTFMHTALVLPVLWFFMRYYPPLELKAFIEGVIEYYNESFLIFFMAVFVANGILEIVLAILIATPVLMRLYAARIGPQSNV